MRLAELKPERVSLEFDVREFPAVVARLRKEGVVRQVPKASYDLLFVGKSSLILMNDWDDPCLISRDEQGDGILRRVSAVPLREARAGQRRAAA